MTIALQPFDRTLDDAGAGDFVYRTSSFANYTADGFTAFDQRRLQQKVVAACKRGAFVVVSNSSAAEILSAYTAPEAQKVGLQLTRVPARRAINSKPSSRGPVDEVIVSNVKAGALDGVKPHMAKARLKAKRKSA